MPRVSFSTTIFHVGSKNVNCNLFTDSQDESQDQSVQKLIDLKPSSKKVKMIEITTIQSATHFRQSFSLLQNSSKKHISKA